MVLNSALETFGDALKIGDIFLPLPLHTRGLAAWGDLKFDPSVVKSVRVLPTPDVEGFFVAKLYKTKSIPAPTQFDPLKMGPSTPK